MNSCVHFISPNGGDEFLEHDLHRHGSTDILPTELPRKHPEVAHRVGVPHPSELFPLIELLHGAFEDQDMRHILDNFGRGKNRKSYNFHNICQRSNNLLIRILILDQDSDDGQRI